MPNNKMNDQKNIDFALDLMSKKLYMQNSAHNALEAKIGILFGFVGVVAGSAIVLLQNKIELLGLNIFTIGLLEIYTSLILLVIASQTRYFLDPPDFPAFYSEEALAKEPIQLKNQAIADMKSSYQHNLRIQEIKARYYNLAIWFFVGSILLLFLGILEDKL